MATIYSDNFNRADGSPGANWSTDSGTWTISSNRLTASGTGGISYYNSAPGTADYKVSCNVTVNSGGMCVLARRTASNNFYLVQLVPAPSTGLDLYKQVSGSWTLLGNTTTTPISANTSYKLTISVQGTAIKLFLNDVEKLSATDNAISSAGYPALRIGGVTSPYFDDFIVEDFGGTPPATALVDLIGGFGVIPFAR